MTRILLYFSILWALPCLGLTCAEVVRGELQDSGALESLAKRVGLGRHQLHYFLETDGLAERVQGLLIARYLIDERGEDLISELYWRAEGSTKYSETSGRWLRFSDWIRNRRFWSPYYRDRKLLFQDSLNAVGEELPPQILSSFNSACAKVTEPGFLRGLRAVSGDLRRNIRIHAQTRLQDVKSEISEYLVAKQTRLQRSLYGAADPRIRAKPELLEAILNREIFKFIGSSDYVPASSALFEARLDAYLERSLGKFPKLSSVARALVIDFHFENSPSSYEEFRSWMLERFEKVIELERQGLLSAWKKRPPRLVAPVVMEMPAPQTQESTPESDDSGPDTSPSSHSDSDEFDTLTLELFSDTSPVTSPTEAVGETTETPSRPRRPWRYQRPNTSLADDKAAAEQPAGFLVILTQEARKNMIEFSRNPKLRDQIRKALDLLAVDPNYPSLRTHENVAASKRRGDGKKVYRSSIRMGSNAQRIHWIYSGKGNKTIDVLEMVDHDEL